MKIPASVFERIVASEKDVITLLDRKNPKYPRWFFASRDGGLWIADTQLYNSFGYNGFCVVYCHGLFPKYDKLDGTFISDSCGHIFNRDPDPKTIKEYHAEKVEIVGDDV
jgi:hypothetical protein